MAPSPRILITGGQGRLGRILSRFMPSACAAGRSKLDVTLRDHCAQCADYDLIIHCASVLAIEAEEHPFWAHCVNLNGTKNVLEGSRGRRVVFLSSDYVFGRDGGSYRRECHPPDPVNFYGMSKALAEREVLKQSNALVLRAPFRYGPPWPYDNAFADLFTSARWIEEVAPDIVKAALSDLTGILHIGGERRSIYDMVSATGQPVRKSALSEWAGVPLPSDSSLDSSRWQEWIRNGA